MTPSLPDWQARRLSLNIDRIRTQYERNLTSKEPVQQQMATAMWIIDRLALRVGNEKEEDEADTVGCCSVRVEHLKVPADSHVEFDFLGKDSMRYHQVIGTAARSKASGWWWWWWWSSSSFVVAVVCDVIGYWMTGAAAAQCRLAADRDAHGLCVWVPAVARACV